MRCTVASQGHTTQEDDILELSPFETMKIKLRTCHTPFTPPLMGTQVRKKMSGINVQLRATAFD